MSEKTNKKQQLIKKALLEALRVNLGNISEACEVVGINRTTYYTYLKDDDFKTEVESVEESNIDFAEGKLFELIEGVEIVSKDDKGTGDKTYQTPPNVTATIFYLKTKGKKRGYVERTEHTGADGERLFDWATATTSAKTGENLTDDDDEL